jgi:glycerophosphoryl diester phosphodiesterase
MIRPLLLGHRGARASRNIPENTLASFELSLSQGCDGFEFDVRLSGDGQAVICHDADFDGLLIAKTAAEALTIPTLEQVLRLFASRAFLDIELKVTGLESLTLAALRNDPPQKGCVVSSFLPEVLATIHSLNAEISLGFLCENEARLCLWRAMSAEWVIPQNKLVDGDLVKQVHAAGKKIMVWTVNRVQRMRQLAAWGVDAIISDETHRVTEVISAV